MKEKFWKRKIETKEKNLNYQKLAMTKRKNYWKREKNHYIMLNLHYINVK